MYVHTEVLVSKIKYLFVRMMHVGDNRMTAFSCPRNFEAQRDDAGGRYLFARGRFLVDEMRWIVKICEMMQSW